MRVKKLLLFLVWLFCLNNTGCLQKGNGDNIAIAFYNCENFFDPSDNPAKEDDDFTPDGKFHYTQNVYRQKLHNIATVIQSMNGGEGPAIMGMAEVENSIVLSDLIHEPEIKRHNYQYILYDGPDPRGINVALLYDPKYFSIIRSEALRVDLSGIETRSSTRDILYVYGVLGGDTVHVFVNHWPSRRSSEEDESDKKRAVVAGVDKAAITSIIRNEPSAKIILLGDFNDNPTDNSIAGILGAKGEQNEVGETGLYNPWVNIYKNGSGTETFKHSWNLFDQVIISGAFLQNKDHKLHYESAEIFKPGFIIDHYRGHEGEPHRSFAGTHWINGYSDHFPVILYLAR